MAEEAAQSRRDVVATDREEVGDDEVETEDEPESVLRWLAEMT